MKKKNTTKKKPSVSYLKKKLDRIFSEYIRRRDSDEEGYGACCTCGIELRWKDGDAGHYIRRGINSTRYHEWNVHLQCRSCNRGGERNASYANFLIKKYGPEVLDTLSKLEHQTKRWFTWELEELIEEYKEKLEKLK